VDELWRKSARQKRGNSGAIAWAKAGGIAALHQRRTEIRHEDGGWPLKAWGGGIREQTAGGRKPEGRATTA